MKTISPLSGAFYGLGSGSQFTCCAAGASSVVCCNSPDGEGKNNDKTFCQRYRIKRWSSGFALSQGLTCCEQLGIKLG